MFSTRDASASARVADRELFCVQKESPAGGWCELGSNPRSLTSPPHRQQLVFRAPTEARASSCSAQHM